MALNNAGRGSAAVALSVKRAVPEPAHTDARPIYKFKSPVEGRFHEFAEANRKAVGEPCSVIGMGEAVGRTLALCGAGPSLRDMPVEHGCDDLWAINSALGYLWDTSPTRITAAVGLDQTLGMLRDFRNGDIDVPYYLASTVNPALTSALLGKGRVVRWFHSLTAGWADEPTEFAYYCERWPAPTVVLGSGQTSVPRLIGLAQWLGYERVDVYGADCALQDGIAHANGETAPEAYGPTDWLRGTIAGREWVTRPDMLMGAVDLVRRVRTAEGHVRIMGENTLPVALLDMTDEELSAVCQRCPTTNGDKHHGQQN